MSSFLTSPSMPKSPMSSPLVPQPPKYPNLEISAATEANTSSKHSKLIQNVFEWSILYFCAVHEGRDYTVGHSVLTGDESSSKEPLNWKALEARHLGKSKDSPVEASPSYGMLANAEFDVGKEFMSKTLRFRSKLLENEYLFSVLLPMRVIHLRLGSAILGIYSLGYLVWFGATSGSQGPPWKYGIISMICSLCLIGFILSTWKKGKLYVQMYSSSQLGRILLALLKITILCSAVSYDFLNVVNVTDSLGSGSNVVIFCFLLTTGLSGTFIERIFGLICILSVVAAKAVLIARTGMWSDFTIYLLPIVTTCVLCADVVYHGDKERRMRLLNTKIIQARLNGLQAGSQKTEYLLSLTLPPMIVSKLKEVGTSNFDLIAERFDLTSVMFADIKNYKDVSHTISTRLGVNLLNTIFHHMDEVRNSFRNLERIKTINSKMLIVGGLDKLDDVDHLLELVDMALVYRDMFKDEVRYAGDDSDLKVKLHIGIGIHIGPLVAGIVGKKTFCYEVYGDVVNTASRMLAIAKEGQIIVTSTVWERIENYFVGFCIGEREVKGKGLMKIYNVEGVREARNSIVSELPCNNIKRGSEERAMRARKASIITPVAERRIDASILTSVIETGDENRLLKRKTLKKRNMEQIDSNETLALPLKYSLPTLPSSTTSLQSENTTSTQVRKLSTRSSKTTRTVGFKITVPDIEVPNIEVVDSLEYLPAEIPVIDASRRSSMAQDGTFFNLSVGGGKDTKERRWSALVFTNDTAISRKPTFQKRLSSTLQPNQDNTLAIESEEIIKRISTVKSSRKGRMSIDSSAWVDEDAPLLLKEVTEIKKKKTIFADPEVPDLESKESISYPEVEIQSIKEIITTNFQTDKAKYVLLLTTLALVGGAKEELTDEEHAILEHTGTLKFLMSDMCMTVVQNSMTPYLLFISKELESRYIADTNQKHNETFWNFSVKGIICELIVISIAMVNLYLTENTSLNASGIVVSVILIIFIATGSQVMITAVTTIPEKTQLSPRAVLFLGFWSAITLSTIVTLASASWFGLEYYTLLIPLVLPQFPIIHTFMLDGISYIRKVQISLFLAVFYLLFNYKTCVSYAPLLLIIPYMTIFHSKEITLKSEYLMQLIATTQANLVNEEAVKSEHILATILPKRIIVKLLEDPNTMFFEEFPLVTVLHMDIAGFTAMSTKLEPLDIVKIFNNLFTYFDHLTQDFHLEKITTIGDAYVVSSNLGKESDPRTSAISVCIMALKMQSFIVNQVNTSYVMRDKFNQTISMRIGIHSGPCYGAIMGGDKNFRYDLMGDTVVNAEKVQEHCEIPYVYISEVTYDMVNNYDGFKLELTDIKVAGMKVYKLSGEH
ncbi:hypothetical protein BCR33DRAFT_766665 [Rhizoclosmatium globosum]|uniref:adenylate cyclase n=1 Tax=Rhizoclosmatium globosum TaxID=329046 RepID=A0A1Y2C9F5_9FUNG|nr:hypothetical protein BCR33DRAFT_766665 [Rhizoclosmatium globosum]|eukprot:ORY43494.1 hypothetical protein BCR33DRAFT_766665 [Rhizoclosmatium globosum]